MTNRSDKTIAANDPKMVNSRAKKNAIADASPGTSASPIASTKPIADAAFVVAPLSVSEAASVSGSDVHELKAWAAACFQRKESVARHLSEAAARLEAAEEQAKRISSVLHGDTKIRVLVDALKKQPIDNALVLLALMRLERNEKASDLEDRYSAMRTTIARKGAHARIQKDSTGTQSGKRQVYGCWKEWQAHSDPPSRYKNNAVFARDMLSKWPNELRSESTIKNWCTQWARGENIPQELSSS